MTLTNGLAESIDRLNATNIVSFVEEESHLESISRMSNLNSYVLPVRILISATMQVMHLPHSVTTITSRLDVVDSGCLVFSVYSDIVLLKQFLCF